MAFAVDENWRNKMAWKFLARAAALSLSLLLIACGGDSGSTPLAGGSNGNGSGTDGGDTPGDTLSQVGTIDLIANPIRLNTSTSASSEITARVKNKNGVLLAGVPVTFEAPQGGTLQVSQGTTNEAGIATAELTGGDDRRNKSLIVRASAGNVSQSVAVEVTGTRLTLKGPESISFGNSESYQAVLLDSEGNGISGQVVSVSTTLGSVTSSTLTTAPNGAVNFNLSSGNTGGTARLTASAFEGESALTASLNVAISSDNFAFSSPAANSEIDIGTPATLSITWERNGNPVPDNSTINVSTTRGILSPADGIVTTTGGVAEIDIASSSAGFATITARDPSTGLTTSLDIEFVAITPETVSVQATKTQLSLNDSTEIIAIVRDADNNPVKNQIVNFLLTEDVSGGRLSDSLAITDSQGRASTTYIAGSNNSGRDGVKIEATTNGTITDTTSVTVARQALRLAIGTGNELEEPDSVRYIKPYLAIVTDANGSPIEDAQVELSVLPIGYSKGRYQVVDDKWVEAPGSVFCPAEDINQNGQLDPGEDTNNSDKLEPTNSATTSDTSITTAADGSADFDLLYPQNHCNWVKVKLTATVRVGGTENEESAEFFLSCLASDLNNADIDPPGGVEGLYGAQPNCANLD
ncbi:Ig-like domain-containing protein [Marinobacter nauticus]|uniref:Ig-like domain-containing protein n=1 Tax=Marinobacter nauticus TaxID=2743 RepID=UPI0035112E4C